MNEVLKAKAFRGVFVAFAAAMIALCLAPFAAFATEGLTTGIEGSKDATSFDENLQASITLALPAQETKLETDVVFVLDRSSSSEAKDNALKLLAALKDKADKTAKVNVGVVIFNRIANVQMNGDKQYFDLANDYDAIVSAMKTPYSGGTNMHAGLLAARNLLQAGSAPAERKYMVLASDGISYVFCKDGDPQTPYSITFTSEETTTEELAAFDIKYGKIEYVPEDWGKWESTTAGQVEDGNKLAHVFRGGSLDPKVPYSEKADHPCGADMSLYGSLQTYRAIEQEDGVNCFAFTNTIGTYQFGVPFMNYMTGGVSEEDDIPSITDDIIYLVGKNSYVTDLMGEKVNFVNDASALSAKVNGEELTVAKGDAENTYKFNDASGKEIFTLTYYPEGSEREGVKGEGFVWHIGINVEVAKPVSLSYKVALDPDQMDSQAGQHTVFTNEKAELHPCDSSTGEFGDIREFDKPEASYVTISAKKVWVLDNDGKQADSVQFVLKNDGKQVGETKTVSADTNWACAWILPELSDGKWTVEEVDPPIGFTTEVKQEAKDGGLEFTVTNDDVAAEPRDPEDDDDDDDDDNGKTDDKNKESDEDGSRSVLPKTGDTLPFMAVGGVAIVALLVAIVAAFGMRRRNQ